MDNLKNNNEPNPFTLGVIGGLGPLASANFIYELYKKQISIVDCEQNLLRIFTISDPSIPDRTTFLLQGKQNILLNQLIKNLEKLDICDVNEIVILCFTMHALLTFIPKRFSRKICSLVTLALEALKKHQLPLLLLTTKGTQQLKIFQADALWDDVSRFVVLPEPDDIEKIHQSIYAIKKGENKYFVTDFIDSLLEKYGVSGWIAGCTELSLLPCNRSLGKIIIDPLEMLINKYIKLK